MNPLYSSASKFAAGCGWPAFDKCYKGAVEIATDTSQGVAAIEITCAKCAGHLGHVIVGEHMTATNERHCVNSLAIRFVKECLPREKEPTQGTVTDASTAPRPPPRVCMPCSTK